MFEFCNFVKQPSEIDQIPGLKHCLGQSSKLCQGPMYCVWQVVLHNIVLCWYWLLIIKHCIVIDCNIVWKTTSCMCGLPLDLDKPAPASLCDVVRLCTVITTVLYLLHYNIMYVAMFTLLLCIVSQLYCVISCSGSGREASEVNAAAGLTLGRPGSASDALYDTLQAWGYDSLPRRQQNSDGL